MPELNGFPGRPEVWKDVEANTFYLVYFVPDSDPPIPLAWDIDRENLQGGFGTGQPIMVDRTFATTAEANSTGWLDRGNHAQLVNTGEDPYIAWENTVTNQAAVRPYLQDPEVLALVMEGLAENRQIADAEFQQTRWWQTHTDGERDWLLLSLSDPMTATQRLESNGLVVADALAAAGIHQPPAAVTEYITNRFTTGLWTEAQMRRQITALADPAYGHEIDSGLATVVGGLGEELDTTALRQEEVRSMVQTWLGPIHGAWSANQIADWAGQLRTDPDAEESLVSFLRNQRKALLPGYDENLTYDTIASPWRNYWSQVLGGVADETQPVFLDVLNLNNTVEAGRRLREHGITTNNAKVKQDLASAFESTFGGVRRPIY